MNSYKFYISTEAISNDELGSGDRIFEKFKDLDKADQESCWVIYSDAQNRMTGQDLVFLGGKGSVQIDIGILFRRILLNGAPSFSLVHNHPGTSASPSDGDKTVTEKIKVAAELLELRFNDHVIIARDSWYSFASQTLIEREEI